MNSLNNYSVDARAGIIIIKVQREGEVGTGASGVERANMGILATGIALELTDGVVVVYDFEGAELLEREDLWEPLADFIGLFSASFLVMLLVAPPCKGVRQ